MHGDILTLKTVWIYINPILILHTPLTENVSQKVEIKLAISRSYKYHMRKRWPSITAIKGFPSMENL
jgi:hypothetical protein